MSALKLPESQAFYAGAQLWVIKNDPTLFWWKKLDQHSQYLLSQNLLKPKKETPVQIQNILNATDLDLFKNDYTRNSLLLGTEDHFHNKWLLLWENFSDAQLLRLIEMISTQLRAESVRLFSHTQVIDALMARPTASSISISYIENT